MSSVASRSAKKAWETTRVNENGRIVPAGAKDKASKDQSVKSPSRSIDMESIDMESIDMFAELKKNIGVDGIKRLLDLSAN